MDFEVMHVDLMFSAPTETCLGAIRKSCARARYLVSLWFGSSPTGTQSINSQLLQVWDT